MDSRVIIVLMVLVVLGGKGWAADDCISKLTSCAAYLNATGKPDKTCCDGLISVIENDAQCLCNLLKSDQIKQLGINMTKALELPERCGKTATADQCKTTSGASSPTATVTPSGGSSSGKNSTAKGDSNVGSPGAVVSIVPMGVLIMMGVLSHLVVGEFSTMA